MKTSIKTLQDISGLHDLRTYTGVVRKTAKPALPTTAILDLYMRRNEKDRIVKELKMVKKRSQQLRRRLKEVEKGMSKLLTQATQTAVEIRGAEVKGKSKPSKGPGRRGKVILGY